MCKYAVIDLEMCKVMETAKRKKFGKALELIQIGAVLLNEAYEVIDTFVSYVHPEYGDIDRFIEKLTRIHPWDVADAPRAENVLRNFVDWLPDNTKIVSWSMTDRSQIKAELRGKKINIPEFTTLFEEWIDCQRAFGEKLHSRRSYKLSEALYYAAIDYKEGQHDALVDARNTAMLFSKIQKEPELKLSPYLASMYEEPETLSYSPFAALLKDVAV